VSEEPETETPPASNAGGPQSSQRAIARRAGLVAAGTLTSRILGAVRDAVVQASFAVAMTDAFWLAFTIPNSLRVLLGEGAVSGAFVPVLTEVRTKEGEDRARLFYARLAGTMTLVLGAVVSVGVLFPEVFVHLFADESDRSASTFALTVELTAWVFPYIGLMGLAALVTGALHASKRFLAPSFAPALLNVAFIAAALTFVPLAERLGLAAVGALALGALLGGLLQLLAQLPSLRKARLLVIPRPSFSDPWVRTAFLRLGPMLAGLGVYQLNIILSRRFAWELPEGSVTYLFLGQRLVEIPQGMFALAIGSAALPTLAEHASRGAIDEAKSVFRYGLRLALFVAIPSSVALALLAEPSVSVLHGRGAFGSEQITQTARALVWLALGIAPVASVRTVVPMFHALGDTRSPVVASGLNLVVFVGVSLALMPSMQHAGLAVAISAAATAQLALLLLLLRRRVGRLGFREVVVSGGRALAAAAAMGGAVWACVQLGSWSDGATLHAAGVFTLAVVTGALVYLVVARLLGSPEVAAILGTLGRRLRRR